MTRKAKKRETQKQLPPKKSFGKPLFIASLLIAVAAAYFAFRHFSGTGQGLTTSGSSYNVVFVSVDTVRADYLQLYKSSGVETPNLASLAKDGILFEKVISQIPYTLPSHATMFTGLHPVAHGVRDNVEDILGKGIHTIAETFQKNGYNTAGFIGSMVLNRSTGLSKGFEYYDDFLSRADVRGEDLGAIERRAEDVLNSFENWHGKRAEQKPFFAFLHFYDPHDPYDPPAPFAPAERTNQELYKGEIRYVDQVLGKLFEYLRNKGLWDSTVIVVTSDHGEMLNEHGEVGHGFFLYQPALAVPLVIHVPQSTAGKKVSDVVQLVDLPSTILDLAQIPVPKQMQGESLAPVILNNARRENRFALSESYFASIQLGVSPVFSIQDSSWKYIHAPHPELYDLSKDPAESANLIEEKKSLSTQMRQKLLKFGETYRSSSNKTEEKRTITAEQAEQFAALGYLGGSFSEEKWDFGKDPKDFIDDWTRILEATSLTQQGKFTEALAKIDQIIADAGKPTEPILVLQSKCYSGLGRFDEAEKLLKQIGDTPVSSTFLAGIYASTGREKEAAAAYERALQQRFSYFVLYNYVVFLKKTGRTQDAMELVRKVRESRGDDEQARPMLAEIYYVLEMWDQAGALLADLVRERPWEAKWYIQLAGVYQARQEPQKGLSLLLKKYEQFSGNMEYLMRLGILFRGVGDAAREIATFQKMIQVSKNDPRGYFYLAKALLDHQRNTTAAIQLSQTAFTMRPDPSLQVFGHYVLSDAYNMAGKPAESQKELQLAQKLEKVL